MNRTVTRVRTALFLVLMLSVRGGAAMAAEVPAPVVRASLNLTEMNEVHLDSHVAGRSAEMVLQEEDVDVEIVGPVARMVVTQTWRYDGSWFSPGDEAVTEVRTGPLSALFDYWITEGNAIHRGIVRDRRSATAEYAKNLEQRRDPGLVEWIDEGLYRMRLYPVPHNGGLKKQGYTLLTVLPVQGDGSMRLEWHLPVHRVERVHWRVRVAGGPLIAELATPSTNLVLSLRAAADGKGLEGELTKLAAAHKRIELVVRRAPRPSRTWRTASGADQLQVSEAVSDPEDGRTRFLACIAPPGAARELAAVTGMPPMSVTVSDAEPLPDAELLPDAWLPPLRTAARALRLELDETRPADARAELVAGALVGPHVVLFANPFTTAQAIKAGLEQAKQEAQSQQAAAEQARITGQTMPAALPGGLPQTVPPPPLSSPLSNLDFSMPEGIMVPNFKAARERANRRACFANQKTVVGAIEMYNLDNNCRVDAAIMAATCWHQKADSAAAVAASAVPDARGPVKPPAGVEWGYWRNRSRMGVYRARHGLDVPLSSSIALVPSPGNTWTAIVPQGFGVGFSPSPGQIGRIPPWLWQELKKGGYLQSIPQDPGFGPETEGNYCLTAWGNGITCLCHGEIQPRLGLEAPARDQLLSEGVVNGQLLSAALTYIPHGSSSQRRTPFLGWLLLLAAVTLAIWLLGLPFVWSAPIKTLRPEIRASAWAMGRSLLWAIPALILGPLVLVPLLIAAVRLGLCLCGITALTLRVLFDD